MRSAKATKRKYFITTVLSLSFMIIGLGSVSWALLNIGASMEVVDQPLPTKVFEEGEKIGHLEIPALKRKIDLIEGTSDKSLKKGVGHFAQSVMPGVVDNCVISGHRDTFFKGVGKLKKGDILIVETSDGTFTYEVSGTRIVHKDDKTVIVPTDHGVLTLTTCYPFRFIGNAPDRYIISADLIKSE